jgi:ribosomal-protein-alanine N-acetyltransferase
MQIRQMCSADIDALVAIDAAASPFPWSRAKFIESFKVDAPCFVLDAEETAVAFAIYNLVLDEASLLNIAVEPTYQGRGYGAALLGQSLDLIRASASCCFLEVRESNETAIRLYQQSGFEQVGERRNYYPAAQGREHARVMRLKFVGEQAG